MKKILTTMFLAMPVFAFAEENSYSNFQDFKNEYNLGYTIASGSWTKGGSGDYSQQAIDFEIEHLTDFGLWFDVSASLLTDYTQTYPTSTTTQTYPTELTGDQGIYGGINGKLGYGFVVMPDQLLLTPYASFGRNTNLSTYTLSTLNPYDNITSAYFLSMGGGLRADYLANQDYDLYVSQDIIYNLDMADHSIVAGTNLPSSDNVQYTTKAGVKYNLNKLVQFGVGVYFTHYSFANAQIYPNSGFTNYANPNNEFGGVFSVGLTY